MASISKKMQQRRDTAANWTTANPVLAAGELGYESDTKRIKIGDGTTAWNSLSYSTVVANNSLPPMARVVPTASSSTAATTFTLIPGMTYTVPAEMAGKVRIDMHASITNANDDDRTAVVALFRNGGAEAASYMNMWARSALNYRTDTDNNFELTVAAGDVLEMRARHVTVGVGVGGAPQDASLAGGYCMFTVQPLPTSTVVHPGTVPVTDLSDMLAERSTQQTGVLTAGATIVFTQAAQQTGSKISLNTTTGVFTLQPGKYRLYADPSSFAGTSSPRPAFAWYNNTASAYFGPTQAFYPTADTAASASSGSAAETYLTVAAVTEVSFRVRTVTGTLTSIGGNSDSGTPVFPRAIIQEMPNATVVDPGTVQVEGLHRAYAHTTTDIVGLSTHINFSLAATKYDPNSLIGASGFTVQKAGVYKLEVHSGFSAAASINSTLQVYVDGVEVSFKTASDAGSSGNWVHNSTVWMGALSVGQVVSVRESGMNPTLVTLSVVFEQLPGSTVVSTEAEVPFVVETKTAGYTTTAADLGKYIRFTAGVPTFHAPLAADVGRQIVIRNATAVLMTALAGAGATISGSLTVAPQECLALLVTGAGTYDAIGGI